MNEAVVVAIIAAAVSLGGVIGKAWSDYRATESAEEMDDRKALRDYQNSAILKCNEELALCRQKLEKSESVKDRSIAVLEHFAEILEHKEARERQTGGPS